MTSEHHATVSDDWRVYGHNLGSEAHYAGGQFTDARRLLLCAWEGWTSGEPPREEIINEFLATCYAMAMSTGIEEVGEALEAMGDMLVL